MAAAFMLVAGLALSLGWRPSAYAFEVFLVIAFTALRWEVLPGSLPLSLAARARSFCQRHLSLVTRVAAA
jgi:hypothetical protein